MVTIMSGDSTLHDIREQVINSRLSHVPTNFCFLFNGHSLDPNVEETIKATSVAIVTNMPDTHGTQHIILIDNVGDFRFLVGGISDIYSCKGL